MSIRTYILALTVCLTAMHSQAVSISWAKSIPWEKGVIAPALIAGQLFASYVVYGISQEVSTSCKRLADGIKKAEACSNYTLERSKARLAVLGNRKIFANAGTAGLAANALFMIKKVYFDGKRKKKNQSLHTEHHENAVITDERQL